MYLWGIGSIQNFRFHNFFSDFISNYFSVALAILWSTILEEVFVASSPVFVVVSKTFSHIC